MNKNEQNNIVIYTYLDIVACTVNLVICFQTAIIYSERLSKVDFKIRIMHFTGFLSSICGIIFSVFRLAYLFLGTDKYLTCTSLLLVGGVFSSCALSLSLFHLFLRADMINRENNKKWFICRFIALSAMFFNLISFTIFLILRHVDQLPNNICLFKLNQNALIARYIGQTINHITQTLLFVYPLIIHIHSIINTQKQQQNFSINTTDYVLLIRKSIIGMLISSLYTFSLVIIIIFYKKNIIIQNLIVSLSIFDIALTISSVCYASTHVKKKNTRLSLLQYQPQRRRSSYIQTSSSNDIV